MNTNHSMRGSLAKLGAWGIAALILTTGAESAAAVTAQGGFSGPGPGVVTIAQAKALRDDAKISLKGVILRALGGDEYLFSDGAEVITVEIDNDLWHGRSITPKDTIEIWGEVDKDWLTTKIEVDRISGP